MGFTSLQHLQHRRSGSRERYHRPPSSVFRFDYPLDGLLPSLPCQFCFVPAALLGLSLRSVPLSKGIRVVSDSEEPTYRSLVCIPLHRSAGAGLTSCDFWALTLPRVPGDQRMFSTPNRWLLPWVFPFQGLSAEALIEISLDLLSHALSTRFTPRCRRPRVSISLCSSSFCPFDRSRLG